MNRQILLQVTGPAVIIGLLLFGACVVSAWYINQLQTNLANILTRNVASLEAAQDLEIRVRQLRFHSFLYLMDPSDARLVPIEQDHRQVELGLATAQNLADTDDERKYAKEIEKGYRDYQQELAELRKSLPQKVTLANLAEVADKHPIRHVIEPCQNLLRVSKDRMKATAQKSADATWEVHVAMLLLGVLGPVSGLIVGYGMARGLSRSIYQLSVRVQDVAERLDLDAGSVKVVADGNLTSIDRQLQHVFARAEEIASRLQQHHREMLRAERLSAVGQLAASVAHEVRNPLTAVKMLVEIALRSDNRKPLSVEDLHVIHREIARLEQLVQNFLDFARLPTPRRTNSDLRQVIARAADLVRARARQQLVEMDVHLPDHPVLAEVDQDQFSTVLVNLFFNALDTMPDRGRLTVTLVEGRNGQTQISVTDTGPGIAPEIQQRLFTPFASTKETGTGLGLSLSKRIIEEHGGTLTAENGATGGAIFTISLAAQALGDPAVKTLSRAEQTPLLTRHT